jgi:hypothetical protein
MSQKTLSILFALFALVCVAIVTAVLNTSVQAQSTPTNENEDSA